MTAHTFFNAHHSPIGAFASFTFGCKGALGGFGLELKGPANENLFIGVEEASRPGKYKALPFFDGADNDRIAQEYDIEGLRDYQYPKCISSFNDNEVSRQLGAGIDEWKAGDLTFRVASPIGAVPDPETATVSELKEALVPAIYAELTIDNRLGTNPRKAFFGYAGSDRYSNMRFWREGNLVGLGQGRNVAIATDDPTVYAGIGFQPEATLESRHVDNLNFMLGNVGMLVGVVAPGEMKTFRFAIGFYRDGVVTTGLEARYLYTRWFKNVEEVVGFGLDYHQEAFDKAGALDAKLRADLSQERSLMLGHAMRSYYGATQCLELSDGKPLWLVNEGEYRMMNTFDLTVDQIFHELALNPWTVRNVLDLYAARYTYEDRVKFPGGTETYPGGVAFTHDMGVANAFSQPGSSCYEQGGLRGVFSYMSCEELVNWALCACLYVKHTGDTAWAVTHAKLFGSVLQSLVNRDHPESNKRNGVMGLDSSRCRNGSEITTYDSLDKSLGQARNNLYLAVKTWAAYVLLQPLYEELGEQGLAALAGKQAALCAKTIVAAADDDGYLPAVLGEGVEARLIPAIEGLVYPYVAGRSDLLAPDGPFGALRKTIERHFELILRPGICLFPDGGWRLSSTSRNSWLSKIYLSQIVAEQIFGKPKDTRADKAHLGWLMDEDNVYFAWSDQMLAGKAHGSRYYPRGATAILWLVGEGKPPIQEVHDYILGVPDRERVHTT